MPEIYLMPIGKTEAREHMSSTLLNPVSKTLVSGYLNQPDMDVLNGLYSDADMPMWGFQPGRVNTSDWEKLASGDYAIFVPSKDDLLVTRVVYKARDQRLAKQLWSVDRNGNTWELIFFVKILAILQLGKRGLLNRLGYTNERDPLQGHRKVTEKFIQAYDSIPDFIRANSEAQVSVESFSQETTDKLIDETIPKKSRLDEIKKKLDETSDATEFVEIRSKKIKRNQLVVIYAKEKAGYRCQACGFSFTKRDGTKYVEAAHIKGLGEGGADNPDNVVALCANCHKKLDKGNTEARNEVLKSLNLQA